MRMRIIAWAFVVLFFAVASVGGGCSTFGQSFVTSSDGNSIVVSSTAATQDKPVSIDQKLPDPVIAIQPDQQPGRVIAIQPVQRPATTKQWFLVSEPWCSHCPAAKRAFLAKGWPASNVLTIAQCKSRFGFSVPHVPYEFGMDVSSTATLHPDVSKPTVKINTLQPPRSTMRDPSKRYAVWRGVRYDMETWSRQCSLRNCDMCVYLDNAQAVYFSSQLQVDVPNPQSSSPPDVIAEAIAIMKLTPADTVAELGCGDAGVAIQLAQSTGCRVEGYEIDPIKVAEARANVANAGMSDRITIHESNVVGLRLPSSITAVYAYLYPELLEQIKPQLQVGRIAVCPGHKAEGIGMRLVGQCWVRS